MNIQKIKTYIKGHKKTSILIGLILLWIIYAILSPNTGNIARVAIAEKTDLETFVRVSGTIVPTRRVEMAFEKPGSISAVLKEAGDTVVQGEVIAILNTGEVDASYRQIEARFRELQRGTRTEELAIAQAELNSSVQGVSSAQIAFNAASYSTLNAIETAFTDSIDTLFTNPRTVSPKLNIYLANQVSQRELESRRVSLESMMKTWRTSTNSSQNVDPSKIVADTDRVRQYIEDIVKQLDIQIKNNSGAVAEELQEYRGNLITAQGTVAASLETLSAAAKQLTAAQQDKSVSQQSLNLKLSGTSREQLDQVSAELAKAAADRGKYVIRAPFAGIVTKQDGKVGQYVQGGDLIVAVMSNEPYKIESFVPEISIAEISVGQKVAVSVEALPDITLTGTVIAIDPAETEIDGVSNYKVTMNFDQSPLIRSGMTVTATIATGIKKDVLAIPAEFVVREAGKHDVMVKKGRNYESVSVETGFQADNGLIEIVSGLTAGDEVAKEK